MLDRIQVTKEVEEMCCVKRGVKGEPAPIPQEGDWTKVKEIKQISETSVAEFKNKTTKEKTRISTSVPEENDNIASNNEYAQKIIPADKEAFNFTGNTGVTLNKMGKYRVTVGLEQIAAWQFKKGYKNIRKGRISMLLQF